MKKNDVTELLATLRKHNRLDCITRVRYKYDVYFITLSASVIDKDVYSDAGYYINKWLNNNTHIRISQHGLYLSTRNMIIYVK